MKVHVVVLPRRGILDPQGKTIAEALENTGFEGISAVRAGKFFEVEVDTDSPVGASAPVPILVESGLLHMTFAVVADAGVEGVSFTISAVACPGGDDPVAMDPVSGKQPLEPIPLPVGDPDGPLGPLAGHRFADIFSPLAAGCYEVSVLPLDAAGEVVEDCSAAYLPLVRILDGETTEVVVVSQCEGDPVGAIDVIVAINHPPQIEDFSFEPSKFVLTCEAAQLCVTASDPDGDPLEFVWAVEGDPVPDVGPHTSRNDESDGVWTNCVEVAVGDPSSISVTVTIYDRLSEAFGGGRIEDLLAEQGGGESHESLNVPLHTGADIHMWCVERDGSLGRPEGIRRVHKHPSCVDTAPSEIFCDAANPDVEVECPDGEFDPSAVYEPCVCDACMGGVAELRLRWNGPNLIPIVVTDSNDDNVLCQWFSPGQEVLVHGRGPQHTMPSPISVRIGDEARFVVPTDCSIELAPGTSWGGLEVIDGASSEGGPFCVFPPDPGGSPKP